MSLNGLTIASLKAKTNTLPLHWWKLVMTLKALTAPTIGSVMGWILMELGPMAPISLGNRLDQIVVVAVAIATAVVAGCSVAFWQMRRADRLTWIMSVLFCTASGLMASMVVFQLMHASTYVY